MRSAVSKVVWRHRKGCSTNGSSGSTTTDDDKAEKGRDEVSHSNTMNASIEHGRNKSTSKGEISSPEQPQTTMSGPCESLDWRDESSTSPPRSHPLSSLSMQSTSANEQLLLINPTELHHRHEVHNPDCPSDDDDVGCPAVAMSTTSLERRIQELEDKVKELTQLAQHQAILSAASPSMFSTGTISPSTRLGLLPPPPLSPPKPTLPATTGLPCDVRLVPLHSVESRPKMTGVRETPTVPPRYPTIVNTRHAVAPQSPLHYRSIRRRDETVPHLESPAPSFSRSHRYKDSHTTTATVSATQTDANLDDIHARHDERVEDCRHEVSGNSVSSAETRSISASIRSSKQVAAVSPLSRRNLSLTLLFEGDHDAYETSTSTPLLSSMTPAESQWLRPQLIQYQREQQQLMLEQETIQHSQKIKQSHRGTPDEQAMQQGSLTKHYLSDSTDAKDINHNSYTDGLGVNDPTDINDEVQDEDTRSLDGRTRSHSITDEVNVLRKQVRTKWLNYLNSVQEAAPDVDVQMEEFIQIPAAVEKIMSFGFCICVDSFLYMCTVLPIRFVWSCLLLLMKVLCKLIGFSRKNGTYPLSAHFQFHRRHLYQLIQVLILFIIYQYVLSPISIGKLYHWIRGQAMIKLYVVIAMVELCDRLFSSLGQDCLDSMYWNTVSRPRSSRFLVSVIVVLVYAALHAIILFVHMATLNVAMNSADQALLTLLISGNYAEIKSTVFKKYNRAALFKITAADICERFKLALFLSLVLLLNISQGMDQKQFLDYIRICGLIWCAEVAADWVKHSFISKFNFLPARVYPEYALLLAGDVSGIGHEGMKLDHSHAVVKRIGFAQIPLICVSLRMLQEAAKYASNQSFDVPQTLFWRVIMTPFVAASSPSRRIAVYFVVWVALLILKLILGRLLQRISLAKLYAAPEYSQNTSLVTRTPNPSSKKLQ